MINLKREHSNYRSPEQAQAKKTQGNGQRLGVDKLLGVDSQTKKKNFPSPFLTIKKISNQLSGAHHPRTGWNIQQSFHEF